MMLSERLGQVVSAYLSAAGGWVFFCGALFVFFFLFCSVSEPLELFSDELELLSESLELFSESLLLPSSLSLPDSAQTHTQIEHKPGDEKV